MKKNIKVNVSGMLFNLDEDAYQVLETYLKRLEDHFKNTDGNKEIIEDIERGIADMMNSKLSESKTIITIEDIEEIVKAMGEPYEIDEESEPQKETYTTGGTSTAQRRLYRDSDNKVIAGVCSGISSYLNVDVAWIRILFVILFLISGTGLIIYLVLWVAVPEAITTAQKLEMQGESINIDNIEKKIREELNNLGEQINDFKDKHLNKKKSKINNSARKATSSISHIISAFTKLIVVLFGVMFTLIAVVLLSLLIPTFFAAGGSLFHVFHNVVYFSIPEALHMTIANSADYNLIYFSLIAILIIPLVGIIIKALGFLFNFRNEARGINKAMGILWLVGLILLVFMAFRSSNYFEHKGSKVLNNDISHQKYDTLYIQINPELTDAKTFDSDDALQIYKSFDDNFTLFEEGDKYFSVPEFDIFQSTDSISSIKIFKYSYGEKESIANSKAENIAYRINLNDSLIELSPLFSYPKTDKWRNQRTKIKIYIPEYTVLQYITNTNLNNKLYNRIERDLRIEFTRFQNH